jgi:eukaryotic-like serine/threonine-protein kinase
MLQPPSTTETPTFGPPRDPIAPLRAALRGHYEIEREIGQGAFATVYLARDLKHERKVALKVLNADPTSDTGELRFIREIRLLARLQHPNILPLHDSGHVEALLYYVMPYVSGETVRDRINRERQLPVDAACSLARELADALGYAHAQGVIHRDIKPENILISAGHPILADFGIARAIDLAGVRQLTRTGMGSPGTPAYMSPEQLMGDKVLDGRSDTYSLGCVLFEMLTGSPPFSGKEGFVRRFTEAPPSVLALRKNLPSWVDAAVKRALARDPVDRYQTAQDFVKALCGPTTVSMPDDAGSPSAVNPGDPVAPVDAQRNPQGLASYRGNQYEESGVVAEEAHVAPRSTRGIMIGLGIGTALLFTLGVLVARGALASFGSASALDSSRVVVIPFRGEPGSASQATRGFEDALATWRDLHVVPAVEVNDAIRNAGPPSSLSAARALATRLRARRMLWGEVVPIGTSMRVRSELYDVAEEGQVLPRIAVVDAADADPSAFVNASLSMLKAPQRPALADGGDGGTHSFAAWNSYGEAHRAFGQWNLGEAERQLASAVATDPDFAAAQTWLAQIIVWVRPDGGEWQEHAVKAATRADELNSRDRNIAAAVAALAAGDFPTACKNYREITVREPNSFIGWYGLGECQRLDQAVIRNSASPSGWSFRSSLHDARRMYMRALQLEPRAHGLLTFKRMEDLLPTQASETRLGRTVGSPVQTLAAFPSLAHDTLSFVPYTLSQFAITPTPTHNAALDRNSELLLSFASNWTRQAPQSADAYEALADILDFRGDVFDRSEGPSALAAIATARRLSTDPQQQLRLSAKEARVSLKRGEFSRVSAIADSLFASHVVASPVDADELVGLSALTGRIGQTARFARYMWLPIANDLVIAPPLADAAANLFAAAALGVCGETATSLEQALDRALQSYVPEVNRNEARTLLASRSYSMLVPCTGGQTARLIQSPNDRLYRMQVAFARGDVSVMRATFDTLARMRRSSRAGDLSMDYTYQEAWLRAAIGDTAGAVSQLDLAFGALPALNGVALRKDVGAAAAVGRAMVLRADIAGAQHDTRTAKHYAAALAVLWGNADSQLQPTVARMRRLAATK